MSASDASPDLLDLKLLPAWVKEPASSSDYSNFEGEEIGTFDRGDRRPRRVPERRRNIPKSGDRKRNEKPARRDHAPRGREPRREQAPAARPNVTIEFLPHAPSLANVIVQIKAGTVAYSVYALARMFLEKPERYHVKLTASSETPLFQLGERGPVSTNRQALENGAFESTKDDFYKVEVSQSEPLKGNFTNVARCRLSRTLLGPTNHHSYQAQLRNLYEQRFSRRMSFLDYQRQIEIVSDPTAVEQWKEQARNVTTFTTLGDDPARSFTSAVDAERYFRQNHLPNLLRTAGEFTIDGVTSRRLADHGLRRVIEDAWSHETRSPSRMMQELVGALRSAGLNIFRHRRNMLFVSPIRSHPFGHELTGVSPSIGGILTAIAGAPGINRHNLAERLVARESDNGDADRLKLTLAADLKWLISEGYVIEFNDGSLDLPRVKTVAPIATEPAAEKQMSNAVTDDADQVVAAAVSAADAGSLKSPNESNGEPAQEVAAIVVPAVESDKPGA